MAIYVYDKDGNKRAWAGNEDDASLAKAGLSKSKPASNTSSSNNNYSSSSSSSSSSNRNNNSTDYPTSGSVWVTRPDGTQTAASARDLQKLLEKGYSYVGVRTNDTGLYSTDGDLIQSRKGGKSTSNSTNNNTNMIGNQYDQQRKSLIAQLKQKIAEAKQGLQPMRNEVEVGRNQNVNALREALANSGDRGGLGRQELLGVNTAADNQLNNINLSEANIDRQAAFEESSINADTAAAKLQAILAEKTRADEMSEDIRRYNNDYGLRLEDRSIAAKDREAEAAENVLKREIETIGRYYTDFQAEINRRTNSADKADDALVPYLEAARAEKIAKQLADADNSASQAYKNAYNMWLQLGVATPEVARILGIEAGAKTLDKVKAEYSTSKPYYNPSTSGSSGGSNGEVPWYLQ
jgi:hypothetical protein